jgi:hypothetical protein
MIPFAEVSVDGGELSVLFILLAVVCLVGAAYCAWVRNLVAVAALVLIAIVCLIFGT